MSMTYSVGVFGADHWSYMAHRMAGSLDSIIRDNCVNTDKVPRGIYYDAKRFFRLIRGAVGELNEGKIPENPPASLRAYVIAEKVIRRLFPNILSSYQEQGKSLLHYCEFIDGLETPRTLNDSDARTANELKIFFEHLHEEGMSERRKRRV